MEVNAESADSVVQEQAALLTGLLKPAIHKDGASAFFGMALGQAGEAKVLASHEQLAALIRYLQAIALEARQRRMAAHPDAGDLEPSARSKLDPLASVDFEVDPSGKLACVDWTTKAGVGVEAQMDYELVRKLSFYLPQLIREMERRQKAASNTQ